MNHTPGPWIYECKPGRSDGFVFSESDPEGLNICTIDPDLRVKHDDRRKSDDWVFSDRRAADARLIAAAPDLLAALSEMLSASDLGDLDSLANAAQSARATIAKARGQS